MSFRVRTPRPALLSGVKSYFFLFEPQPPVRVARWERRHQRLMWLCPTDDDIEKLRHRSRPIGGIATAIRPDTSPASRVSRRSGSFYGGPFRRSTRPESQENWPVSQVLAKSQSRFNVGTEISRASAASVSVSPPKNRSSTILAARRSARFFLSLPVPDAAKIRLTKQDEADVVAFMKLLN